MSGRDATEYRWLGLGWCVAEDHGSRKLSMSRVDRQKSGGGIGQEIFSVPFSQFDKNVELVKRLAVAWWYWEGSQVAGAVGPGWGFLEVEAVDGDSGMGGDVEAAEAAVGGGWGRGKGPA